jgi:hypothetical protein
VCGGVCVWGGGGIKRGREERGGRAGERTEEEEVW